jgi:erythromycin esterase-like protein
VLVGEASHGTSEFYRWRAELTRRLVTEKGFSFLHEATDRTDAGWSGRSASVRSQQRKASYRSSRMVGT